MYLFADVALGARRANDGDWPRVMMIAYILAILLPSDYSLFVCGMSSHLKTRTKTRWKMEFLAEPYRSLPRDLPSPLRASAG